MEFPADFKFGAASASYQVEGGWNVDGRGPSIWDNFTHTYPERIADRSNGDDAALSYFLYKEDVAALKNINAQFYRFSVSWSRVMTNGDIASRNQLGIDYYNKLINELLANGIEPMITLFHWDMPQPIQDFGGLRNPLFIEYFVDYADLLFAEFGDRVKEWITFNEPLLFCSNGYANGVWPPALIDSGVAEYDCSHNTILSHVHTYHLYHDKYSHQNGNVGITLNVGYSFPADPTSAINIAARDRNLQFYVNISYHVRVFHQIIN